jgi:mRNA interferase MazF
MKQGDVYWYTFRAPDKRRPVLVLTRNSALSFLTSVSVAPITSTIRGIPTEIELSVDDGMFMDCAVNVDNLQTIQKQYLDEFITHLSIEKMRDIRRAIEFAFGFDKLK